MVHYHPGPFRGRFEKRGLGPSHQASTVQGIVVVAAGSVRTLANIELGSRSVNPDAGSESARACKCGAKLGSFASADIDAAAPAAVVGFTNSGVEKVPAPGEFEIAEAWQPMQLILVGPLNENTASAHPFVAEVAEGAAAALVLSVPTTPQYHPSHQRLESLIITLQNRMRELGSVSAYSSLNHRAVRYRTLSVLNGHPIEQRG